MENEADFFMLHLSIHSKVIPRYHANDLSVFCFI